MIPTTQRIVLNGFLRSSLDYRQVYVLGQPWSFSQNGNFSGAYRVDDYVNASFATSIGPGSRYPTARIRFQKLEGAEWANKDFIVTTSGQSVGQGASTGLAEDETGGALHGAYSIIPPLPGRLLVVTGGTIPNQAGAGSPSSTEVIDAAQYASLVDARELINTGRDANKDVNRETPGFHFALHLCARLPASSRVILVNWGAGSTDFAGVVGTFASPAIPASNCQTMLYYLKDTLLAGRTVQYAGHAHYGHEGDSTQAVSTFYVAQAAELRLFLNAWGTYINAGAAAPKLIWTCVGTPRRKWNDTEANIGEASWQARGQQYVIANNLDTAFTGFNMCYGLVASDTVFPTPHYDAGGYPNLGQKAAAVLIDMMAGTYTQPPYMVDDNTAYRVVNSSVVNATVTREVVSDPTVITNPGPGGGIQSFTADSFADSSFLVEKTISSVACTGTALTVTLAAPGDPRRETLTSSFKTATQVDQWCGLDVTAASYDDPTDTVTLTVDGTLLLTVGDTFNLLDVYGAGLTGPYTATAGTTGSSLKYSSVTDPTGGFTPGGNVVKDASFCLGRTHGLRTTWRARDVRHYSNWDGAGLPDYMLPQSIAIKTYCSMPGLADQIAQLNTYIPGGFSLPVVFDIADSNCYGGTGIPVTNLGSTGSTDDINRGDGATSSTYPTFNGVANSLNRSTYFSSDGGDYFSPKNVSTFSRSSHQAGGCITAIVAGTATVGSSQWFGATCQQLAGGGPGWGLQLAANGKFQIIIRGAANALVYSLATGVTLSTGNRFVVGACVKDGDYSWIWVNGTLLDTSSATFASPSAATSEAAFRIGNNPGGSVRLSNGTQINEAAYSTTYYEFGELQPLLNSIYRRHIDNAY